MATPAATATPQNALVLPENADKFRGFSTKDGEIQQPKPEKNRVLGGTNQREVEDLPDDTGDDPEAEGGAPARPHASAQDRINKAVGKQRRAEREAEDLRAQLRTQQESFSARLAVLESGGTKKDTKAEKTGAPKPDDYKFGEMDAQYISDLARYETRQEIAKERKEQADKSTTDTLTAEQKKAHAQIVEFTEKGLDKFDDFDDVVIADRTLPFSKTLVEAAFESEHGPDILYEAALDKKTLKALKAMSPSRQAAWFGAREAELSSDVPDAGEDDEDVGDSDEDRSRSPSTKGTKAPAPIGRARGTTGSSSTTAATSDFAAFERMVASRNRR